MRYTIKGADRTTGKDVMLTFEARSDAEAEAIAGLSMVVAEVVEEKVEPLPVEYAPAEIKGAPRWDWEAGIKLYARVLGFLALAIGVVGVIGILHGLWLMGRSLMNPPIRIYMLDDLLGGGFGTGRVFFGIVLLSLAAFLRLSAFVALAVGKMAQHQNSNDEIRMTNQIRMNE